MYEKITQSAIFDKIRVDLGRNLSRLRKTQNVLTTGKRINRPSDDPVSVVRVMKRKVDLNKTDRFLKNTENAKNILDRTSLVLEDVTQQISRARELAIAFANDPSVMEETSTSSKIEIQNILNRIVNLANTKEDGRFIFAGGQTLTQPFQVDESTSEIAYNGNMREIRRKISPSATIPVNFPGVNIFSDGVFLSLERLLETVDIVNNPQNEVIADESFSTSEIYAKFTASGNVISETTEMNSLDQVNNALSDGDIITISGKDANGYDVEETFTYGTENDGTTLGDLVEAIDSAFENSNVSLDNMGNIILDFTKSPMNPPELTIQFNENDSVNLELSDFNNIELNKLDQVSSDFSDGDTITITGKDSDETDINATFTYGQSNDGTTLGDLITVIDSAFENSNVTIDNNGFIRATSKEENGKKPSLSLTSNADVITLPQFNDKMADSIQKLDQALNKVLEFQADIGSKINRLDDTKDMLEDVKLNIKELISDEEEADMAEAITEFVTRQNVYQAALNAAVKIMQQPSLMDFIR